MRAIMVALVLAGPVQAQEWTDLTGAEIADALTDRLVTYDNDATQRFFASGRTLYTHGEPSWGSWEVREDAYCSLWPPAPVWDCYTVQGAGPSGIAFEDDHGNRFEGRIAPE